MYGRLALREVAAVADWQLLQWDASGMKQDPRENLRCIILRANRACFRLLSVGVSVSYELPRQAVLLPFDRHSY